MKDAKVKAKLKMARISTKKVGIVADLVRGKSLHDAKVSLSFDRTKAAKMLLKLMRSAEANAKNNQNIDSGSLYVSHLSVGPGPSMKRHRAGSKGRVDPIIKRTSHIFLGLDEIDGGSVSVDNEKSNSGEKSEGGAKK